MFGANTNNVIYYKYKIVRIDILIPGKDTITVSYNNIGGIIIEKDFDNCIHPIFEIKLALHPIDIYDILDNKDTVKFNIRLDKYAFSSENNNEYLYRDLSFNETFTIYMDDNTVQMDKELYKKTKEVKGNRVDIDDISETYSFFLFKEKDIDSARLMINNIITDCNMTDVITYLLSSSGCNNVLMTPMDNQNTYNEIILYPVTLLDNITRLDHHYGFYRYGLLFFMDINRIYFIDKRGRNTAYSRGEFTDVFIYSYRASRQESMSGGFEVSKSEKMYKMNILTSMISMKTSGYIMNETIGTNLIMVDSLNDNINEVDVDIKHKGSSKSVVVDRLENGHDTNEYIEFESNARLKEGESIFEVSFAGIDMDILTPNKRYTFVFEDSENQKRVGGVYRLSRVITHLMPKGTSMNVTATCTFLKIE
jgi:hypothetical protein